MLVAEQSAAAARSRARESRLSALRAGAIALVVFIHASTTPDALSADAFSPAARAWAGITYRVASTLAVPTFLVLAFMQLHPALSGPLPLRRVAQRAGRLLPPYLFWTAVYGGLKFASGAVRLTPAAAAEWVLLGGSAAHMYFLPLLVALTATLPVWLAVARRPPLAVAAVLALPLGAAGLISSASPGPWASSLLGLAGNAAYAIAGLALVERWRGWEPPPDRARRDAAVLALAALASGAVVAAHGAAEGLAASALPASLAMRVARVAFPIATAGAVLASRASFPAWTAPLAPITLGVYLVHPLVVKPLRVLEAHVPQVASHDLLLAVPNTVLGLGAAAFAVYALFGTRLRRVLA